MRRGVQALGWMAACLALAGGRARAERLPDSALSAQAPRPAPPLKPLQRLDPGPLIPPSDPPRREPAAPPQPEGDDGDAPTFVLPGPALPDTGTFEWLLFDLARPVNGKPRGLTTSSAFVALSADAPQLAPETRPGDLAILRNPALNATVDALPAGSSILGFLAPPQADVDSMKLRQVGKLVLDRGGLLQRTGRRLLGSGTLHDVVLGGVGAAVSAAVIAKLGTAQAYGLLGFDPSTHVKLFGDRLDQRVGFHCDPKLKNPGVDLTSQFHLLHVTAPRWTPLLTDAYLEGGVTVQRGAGPSPIPVRWAKLHLVNGRVDGGLMFYDPPSSPPVLSLDSVVNAGRARLHLALSREDQTGVLGATGTLITTLGPLQTGLFFGGRRSAPTAADRGFTTGVIAMAVF